MSSESRLNRCATTPKVEGEILSGSAAYFEYKVHNFSSLPEQMDDYVDSPVFTFLDSTWCFRIYLFGQSKENSEGWIGLYFIKKSSDTSERICYKLGIKKDDGTEYKSFTFEDTFQKNGIGWGKNKFVQRCTLLTDKMQIAPDDTVTFFCSLYAIGETSKEATTETKCSEGFKKLQEDLESLIDAEDGDVILKLEDKLFKAHKALLRVRSPIFEGIFSQKINQEKIKGRQLFTVEVPDCRPAACQEFLQYMYCGKVQEFSKNTVFDLFSLADTYDVQELRKKCLEFIINNITIDTIYDALNLSVRYKNPSVWKNVSNFFKEHAMEIIADDKWKSFLRKFPGEANEFYVEVLKNKFS